MDTVRAAKILGVSPRTIRRWIEEGRFGLDKYVVVQRYRKGNVIQYRYYIPVDVVNYLYRQRKVAAVRMQKMPPSYLFPFPTAESRADFEHKEGRFSKFKQSWEKLQRLSKKLWG